MKKGDILELKIEKTVFPGESVAYYTDGEIKRKIVMKGGLTGQRVSARITQKRSSKCKANILEVIEKSDEEIVPNCSLFGTCGGCGYQNLPYETQLKLKAAYVQELLEKVASEIPFEGILPSPEITGYRNKMELSFGDAQKDGPLCLGLHEKGSFYNIVNTEDDCNLVDADFLTIQKNVRQFFSDKTYFHKRTHIGFLRHLVIRKGKYTQGILLNLVTTSQERLEETEFVKMLLSLSLKGKIVGIIHTVNDGVADVVKSEAQILLYGVDYIEDNVLGYLFRISPFSFFQTNTKGAETLYKVVQEFLGEKKHSLIYDLYCGTGTIAQVLSNTAEKIVGIELVKEAVAAANENAKLNGIKNCSFIAGDVMEEVQKLGEKPEVIILDPPRDGIHPKAIFKIIAFNPEIFVYVSCKATSLARDLPFFLQAGYKIQRVKCVDLFPNGGHVETVVLMSRVED